MAATDTPTPTAAVDVVCVLNEALQQVFAEARPMKASIKPESKGMEHPLETGSSITDHRIILPLSIEISMVLASQDYAAVYGQIRDMFMRGELLTVQTRVGSFRSLYIEKMPHDETSEMLDGVALALSLREARFVAPRFTVLKVAKPRDSTTTKRGELKPKEVPPAVATERRGSILSGVFRK